MPFTYESPANSYPTPGGITISAVQLLSKSHNKTVQLDGFISDFSIIESIENTGLYFDILIMDTNGLVERFPIIGEEAVYIKFKTPGNEYNTVEGMFHVYKVSPRRMDSDTVTSGEAYMLHCCSRELLTDLNTKVLTAYHNLLYSDMVERVFYDYLLQPDKIKKSILVEPTVNSGTFTPCDSSPVSVIMDLATQSVSKAHSKVSNFVFYEDLRKIYRFRTIESMMAEEPVENFYYRRQNLETKEEDKINPLQTIYEYSVDKTFNVIDDYSNGMLYNETITIDLLTKQAAFKVFNYSDDKDISTLGKYKMISDNSPYKTNNDSPNLSVGFGEIWSSGQYNAQPYFSNVDDNRVNNPDIAWQTWHKRKASFAMLDTLRIKVSIPGNTNIHAGDIVNIYIPQIEELFDRSNRRNNRLFGTKPSFLVISAKHSFETNSEVEYITELTCVKNGYAVNPTSEMVNV